MFKDFKNYDDFVLNYNMAKDSLITYNRYLNALTLKNSSVGYTKENWTYYEFVRSKVHEAAAEIEKYKDLAKKIFTNQKNNREMIEIILNTINQDINIENNYSIKIITIFVNQLSEVNNKRNYELKLEEGKSINATTHLLLVRNDFNHLITEVLNSEKFEKYQKEGYIIELDKVPSYVIDNETKLNRYLEQKTIDIDKIKGLKPVTKEIIREKLFNDYQKEENKPKTLKKAKKEEQ